MSRVNIIEVTNLSDLKSIMESNTTVILGVTVSKTSHNQKVIVRRFLKRKSEQFPLITFVYMDLLDQDRNTLNILKGRDIDFPKLYHIRDGCDIAVTVTQADEEKMQESFNDVEQIYIKEMKIFQDMMAKKNGIKTKNQNDTPISNEGYDNRNNNSHNLINNESNNEENEDNCEDDDMKKIKFSFQNDNNSNKPNKDIQQPKINPLIEKKKNLEKLTSLNKKYDDMRLDFAKEITKRKKTEVEIEKQKQNDKKKEEDTKKYRKAVRKTNK
jgi:hypothetical protein